MFIMAHSSDSEREQESVSGDSMWYTKAFEDIPIPAGFTTEKILQDGVKSSEMHTVMEHFNKLNENNPHKMFGEISLELFDSDAIIAFVSMIRVTRQKGGFSEKNPVVLLAPIKLDREKNKLTLPENHVLCDKDPREVEESLGTFPFKVAKVLPFMKTDFAVALLISEAAKRLEQDAELDEDEDNFMTPISDFFENFFKAKKNSANIGHYALVTKVGHRGNKFNFEIPMGFHHSNSNRFSTVPLTGLLESQLLGLLSLQQTKDIHRNGQKRIQEFFTQATSSRKRTRGRADDEEEFHEQEPEVVQEDEDDFNLTNCFDGNEWFPSPAKVFQLIRKKLIPVDEADATADRADDTANATEDRKPALKYIDLQENPYEHFLEIVKASKETMWEKLKSNATLMASDILHRLMTKHAELAVYADKTIDHKISFDATLYDGDKSICDQFLLSVRRAIDVLALQISENCRTFLAICIIYCKDILAEAVELLIQSEKFYKGMTASAFLVKKVLGIIAPSKEQQDKPPYEILYGVLWTFFTKAACKLDFSREMKALKIRTAVPVLSVPNRREFVQTKHTLEESEWLKDMRKDLVKDQKRISFHYQEVLTLEKTIFLRVNTIEERSDGDVFDFVQMKYLKWSEQAVYEENSLGDNSLGGYLPNIDVLKTFSSWLKDYLHGVSSVVDPTLNKLLINLCGDISVIAYYQFLMVFECEEFIPLFLDKDVIKRVYDKGLIKKLREQEMSDIEKINTLMINLGKSDSVKNLFEDVKNVRLKAILYIATKPLVRLEKNSLGEWTLDYHVCRIAPLKYHKETKQFEQNPLYYHLMTDEENEDYDHKDDMGTLTKDQKKMLIDLEAFPS